MNNKKTKQNKTKQTNNLVLPDDYNRRIPTSIDFGGKTTLISILNCESVSQSSYLNDL